jgi:tRNA(Ile)-lysidine synthase
MDFLERVEEQIRRHDLIPAGGEVTCLVSGGADSCALWHSLRELGYAVSALHVNHALRGAESDEDAKFCASVLGAEVVQAPPASSEAELRDVRYSFATDRLRATGHTASDQVETVVYRLVSSGKPGGIKPKREDGVVRPLLGVWRDETEGTAKPSAPFRATRPTRRRSAADPRPDHSSAPAARRARGEICLRSPRAVRAARCALESAVGSARVDLGGGCRPCEYDRVWLERGPSLKESSWGPWRISSSVSGLKVRGWRAGDRLANRSKKLQDVFVDAKVPRSHREAWPLVVRGDEVVAVPGIVDAEGVEAEYVQD